MNPLMLTITFLTVMALLTSSEAMRNVDEGIKDSAYKSHLLLAEECEKLVALSEFEELQEGKVVSEKDHERAEIKEVVNYTGKSAPLNFDHGRPPNNSRINLFLLMCEIDPKQSPLYEQTAHLLRNLYGTAPFFQEIPNVEYLLLDTLVQYKEESKKFFFADELGALPFKDKQLQKCFLKMLKGSPPLLHYITFDTHCNGNQKKLNFMFAPAEILAIAIPDFATYQKALRFRNELWKKIDTQEQNRLALPKDEVKNRSYYKAELTNFLEGLEPGLSKKFDVSLGKKGNVIFVQDPVSRIVKRERIMKKRL